MEKSKVICFKLSDGSIMFGQRSTEGVIYDPCSLETVRDPQTGQATMGFIPVLRFMKESKITLKDASIVYEGEANESFTASYFETITNYARSGQPMVTEGLVHNIIVPDENKKKLILPNK